MKGSSDFQGPQSGLDEGKEREGNKQPRGRLQFVTGSWKGGSLRDSKDPLKFLSKAGPS